MAQKNKNNSIGNNVPKVNLEKNLKTYLILEEVIKKELLNSSISISSGGLVVSLAKASVGGMIGCQVSLKNIPGEINSEDIALFSESQGRILVTVAPKNIAKFEKMMKEIPCKKIGQVTKNNKFIVTDFKDKKIIEINVNKLYTAYHSFSNKMK